MGGASAAVSVEESARGIRRVMEYLDDSQLGRFWTLDECEHPWQACPEPCDCDGGEAR